MTTDDGAPKAVAVEKKFKCPVHGRFEKPQWAPHRRWCRAGVKGKKKIRKKKATAKNRKPVRNSNPGRRWKDYADAVRVVYGATLGQVVFRNGKREVVLAHIICGNEKKAVLRLKQVVEKALG